MQLMAALETEAQFWRRPVPFRIPTCAAGESSSPFHEREQKPEQHLEIAALRQILMTRARP
jgi:hypothetical protein